MTSSLSSARDQRGEVTAVDGLGGGMVEITAQLPHLAATAQPGQFAQLRCGDAITPLLRRPFSIAWTQGATASFVFAPVGAGTRLLARLRPGDALQALGPLGTGFSVDDPAPRSLCVAGGLGCAPFPLLLRALRERGARDVRVISGAATADRLYPADRFRRGDDGISVIELTVDGTRGSRGLVTAALEAHCSADTALYACGPNPMLAAVHAALVRGDRPRTSQASLEAPMGCGYGTCLGCALPVRGEGGATVWALCCRQGPVMALEAVAWEELMAMPSASVA